MIPSKLTNDAITIALARWHRTDTIARRPSLLARLVAWLRGRT